MRILGHDRCDMRTSVDERASNIDCLVRSNTARDGEYDVTTRERIHDVTAADSARELFGGILCRIFCDDIFVDCDIFDD